MPRRNDSTGLLAKSFTSEIILFADSAYSIRCGFGIKPASNWVSTISFRDCSRFSTSMNFHMVGWRAPMLAWNLLCHPSMMLFVLGSPSSIRLCTFHRSWGVLSRGLISQRAYSLGGFCPRGPMSGGLLAGGSCPGGFCPRTNLDHGYSLQIIFQVWGVWAFR